jgi:hydroxymethylglutaryl-CoA lyase
MNPPDTHDDVILREVGLRDGLQILARTMPTEHKLRWLRGAHEAGLRELEVGSFVPPKLLPQLADTAEVVAHALTLPGLTVSVLVPNSKGAERAIASGAHAMLLPLSASHAHSVANLRKTPAEALDELARMRDLRDARGSRCAIEVGVSTAFGCTIQGQVEPDEVVRLVERALAAGAERVGLADTVGYADPLAVGRLFSRVREVAGERLSCAHFHDTRGLGLANAFAAWQCGIRRLDACLGGLGGCPHAPGASGNVATEDLAYLFASMGVRTGVQFEKLLTLRQRLARWLDGETLHGTLWRAGLPKTMMSVAA